MSAHEGTTGFVQSPGGNACVQCHNVMCKAGGRLFVQAHPLHSGKPGMTITKKPLKSTKIESRTEFRWAVRQKKTETVYALSRIHVA